HHDRAEDGPLPPEEQARLDQGPGQHDAGRDQDRDRLPDREEEGRAVPGDLVELRAVGQPAHQPRGLRDGLLGADGVRGQEEGRERRVRGAEGGLPPLGHGGLYRPEPEALQGAGEGRLRAARLHARRLVRSEDHVEPRLHDEPGGRGLREEQPRGVRAGRGPGDRRDRRQRAEEVPVRRHLAEPLADARGDVRVGVGALQGRVACVARYALLVLPLTFVAGTLLVPLGLMFVWSFWERAGFWIRPAFTLASYAEFFAGVRLSVLERSLVVAAGVTLLGLLLAYPVAYFLALRVRRDLARNVLLLFTIPFLVNYIIRTFSWVYLLSRTGPVTRALMAAGVTYQLMGKPISSALDVLNYPLAAAMWSVVVATMLALLLVWYLAFDLRAVLGKIARWRF